MRGAVDSAVRLPRAQRPADLGPTWIETNGRLVDAIDRLSIHLDSRIGRANATIAKLVQLREAVWSARANSGDDRLFIAAAMARGERLSEQQQHQLISLAAQVDGAWKIIQAQTYQPDTPQELREAVEIADKHYFGDLRDKRGQIIEALSRGTPPPFSTREWLAMSRAGQDSMFQVGAMALTLARIDAEGQLREAQWIFVGALLSIALFLALGVAMALYVSRYVVLPLRKITETTSAVASGELGHAIPFAERRDEIGSLARALRVFRDSAMAKEALRSEKDKALSDLAIAHEQLEAKVEERTRDLTQEIAVNTQLQAKLRQAEKMEALGTLAGGVAHELNNLLQPVIMMTELTLSQLPEQSPHHAQLQRVVDAGGKAAEIVQRILAFGRVDEASQDPLDISSVVRDAVAFVRTILPTSITLHVDILDHAGTVRGDRTQLTQVLINLATNARDAIGANVGGVWISLSRVEGQVKAHTRMAGTLGAGPYAVVKIRDNGSGMDEATLRRIFEPFFTTKGVGKGTGLGLSVTHGIVTGHGGAIDVDTAPSRGTTFSIYLPLDEADIALALTA